MKNALENRLSHLFIAIGLTLVLCLVSVSAAEALTIVATAGTGGKIDPEGQKIVPQGADQSFVISANTGYYIESIDTSQGAVELDEFQTQDSYTFFDVATNHWITAKFARYHTITTSVTDGGLISPAGQIKIKEGSSQTFTIAPLESHLLVDVTIDGWSQGPITEYTFTNVMFDHNISALFSQKNYTITVVVGEGGTVTPEGPITVPYDGSQLFTIIPDPLYAISEISTTVNVKNIKNLDYPLEVTSLGYNVARVKFDTIFEVQFVQLYHPVVASAGTGGSIQPAGTIPVETGEDQTFEITASTGYFISEVKINGVPQSGTGPGVTTFSYKFSNVNSNDNTIEATFRSNTLVITPGIQGSGGINPNFPANVPIGNSSSFVMVPNFCHTLVDVLVDGNSVMNSVPSTDTLVIDSSSGNWTYTFNQVEDNHSIVGVFEEIDPLTLIASAGNGIAMDPVGEVQLHCREQEKYTIQSAYDRWATVLYASMNTSMEMSRLINIPTLTANAALETEDRFVIEFAPQSFMSSSSLFPFKFEIEPDEHWQLDSIAVDGTQLSTTAPQWPGIAPDTEITATNAEINIVNPLFRYSMRLTFIPSLRTVTSLVNISSDGFLHGAISPAGANQVQDGDNRTYTLLADPCFQISNVEVTRGTGRAVSVINNLVENSGTYTYTLTDIRADSKIEATFERISYDVTATVESTESVAATPYKILPGQKAVGCGENLEIQVQEQIAEADCHRFELIVVPENGQGVFIQGDLLTRQTNESSGIYTYTYEISNIQTNYTVTLTYSRINVNVITLVDPIDGGTIQPGSDSGGSAAILCNENQKFEIRPNTGYRVKDIAIDGNSIIQNYTDLATLTYTGMDYTLSNIRSTHTIAVAFQRYYTVSTSGGTGGEIASPTHPLDAEGDSRADEGETMQINVNAEDGYYIETLTIDNLPVTFSEAFAVEYTETFTEISADHTIEATFAKKYTITTSVTRKGTGGIIEPSGTVTVPAGATQTFTFIPDECYDVSNVIANGLYRGAIYEYTFENISRDGSVEVSFAKRSVTISASAGANGKVSPSGKKSMGCGEDMTYAITPDYCYEIDDVIISQDGAEPISVKNTDVAIDPSTFVGTYELENIQTSYTIDVTFAVLGPFTVTSLAQNGGGTVSPETTEVICDGETEIIIMPDKCQQIDDVVVTRNGDEPVSALGAVAIDQETGIGTYKLDSVMADYQIVVSFKAAGLFDIVASVETGSDGLIHGTISPESTQVECGNEVILTTKPELYYIIHDLVITGDGVDPVSVVDDVTVVEGEDGSIDSYLYNLSDISSNYSVQVSFREQDSFTVSIDSGRNGSIEPAGRMAVYRGSDIELIMTPDNCYKIDNLIAYQGLEEPVSVLESVIIDSETGIGTYSLSDIRSDYTLEVTFAILDYYDVTIVVEGEGGAASPEAAETICGAALTATITPDDCYKIGDAKVTKDDGEPISVMDSVIVDPETGIGTYKFENIATDCKMDVSFEKLGPYTITADISGSGKVLVTPSTDVEWDLAVTPTYDADCGANLTFEIIPDHENGYTIQDAAIAFGDGPHMSITDALELVNPDTGASKYEIQNVRNNYKISVTFSFEGIVGDLDGDKQITSRDALLLLRILVGQVTATEDQLIAADMNGDGNVNSFDAIVILNTAITSQAAPMDMKEINDLLRSLTMAVEENALLPNFPNPFNPDTWIPYQLKEGGEVTIRIFTAHGELIREFYLGYKDAGLYTSQDKAMHWDGKNESGENVASGIYFCHLQINSFSAIRKLTILH